jgi:hypothetical protein
MIKNEKRIKGIINNRKEIKEWWKQMRWWKINRMLKDKWEDKKQMEWWKVNRMIKKWTILMKDKQDVERQME